MADFIASCACNGRRPRHLATYHWHSRPHLVSKLMRERGVVRFAVAPVGYGKTSLLAEYAEVVFSFEHVFWVDCARPCFLRDLDAGSLAEQFAQRDPRIALVAFDDLPSLDDARADAFSAAMDRLLERGCEVIVSATPAADAFGRRQPDRMTLGARDLLVADAELKDAPCAAAQGRCRASAADRVAALCWGGPDARTRFVEGAAAEDVPVAALASMFEMFAIPAGQIAFKDSGASSALEGGLGAFARAYPHFGIEGESGRYEAPEIDVASIARAFRPKLASVARARGMACADELAIEIADRLVAARRAGRACEVVGALGSRCAQEAWLARRSAQLVDLCCLLPATDLYSRIDIGRSGDAARLRADQAMRYALLGDRPKARSLALSAVRCPTATLETLAASAIVAALGADGSAVRDELRPIRRALDERGGSERLERAALRGCGEPCDDRIRAAALVALAFADGPSALESAWQRICSADPPPAVLAAGAFVGLRLVSRCAPSDAPDAHGGSARGGAREVSGCADAFRRALMGYLEQVRCDCAHGDALVFSAVCALGEGEGQRDERGPCAGVRADAGFEDAPLAPDVLAAAARTERLVAADRIAYARRLGRPGRHDAVVHARSDGAAGAPGRDAAESGSAPASPLGDGVPPLRVRLFGGLEVFVGDLPANPKYLRRQKTKALLAILALNAGKEVPRPRLSRDLWPESDPDTARKNLYTIWSQLRHALMLPDGSCPYLEKLQHGYRLSDRGLACDVSRVDDLCRALLLGKADGIGWDRTLEELESLYVGELMPCETESRIIVKRRAECHEKVIDALVAASGRLIEEGDLRSALWFARDAFDWERGREDVYATLMRAQIASGQRVSAVSTYFQCRRFLAEELGLDPSGDTVDLYRSVIEEEAPMEW